MTNLTSLTIRQALDGLKKKDFTATELTEAHIKASEAARHLNCYITETFDHARKQAKESDARYASGRAGLLDGVPIAMKDFTAPRASAPRRAARSLKTSSRLMNRPSPATCSATAR